VDEYRWLAGRMIESHEKRDATREAARRRRLLPRETMATLMLGTASVALATVMMVVTLPGLAGFGFAPWSEPRELMVEETPPRLITRWDALTNHDVTEPALVSAGRVYLPSRECDLLAFFSLALGGIGIALSVRRRRFSWLSAIGFTVTLVMMAIVVAEGTTLNIWR
jgi:hypothetical protein